jgi:hypothetical protein
MRSKLFVSLLSLFVLVCVNASLTKAQQDPNDEVTARGTFISSRPSSSLGSGSSVSTPSDSGSKTTSSKTTSSKNTKATLSTTKSSKSSKFNSNSKTNKNTNTPTDSNSDPKTNSKTNSIETYTQIGLGYSLVMQDKKGRAIRVDPSRTFRAGDRVRLVLESNIAGYLYVFYRENDSDPIMLFPDARLNNGNNYIQGHVPTEIPSSKEIDERYRWFVFDNKPAIENLYIIVTREPLADVPTGADLINFCNKDATKCVVPVSASAWLKVEEGLKENAITSVNAKQYNQWQTEGENHAIERGLGLSQDDPEPTIVRMTTVSSKSKTLVTAVALKHN